MLKGLTSIILLFCGLAQAQVLPPLDAASQPLVLERKVQQLQASIASHDSRLLNLEYSQWQHKTRSRSCGNVTPRCESML